MEKRHDDESDGSRDDDPRRFVVEPQVGEFSQKISDEGRGRRGNQHAGDSARQEVTVFRKIREQPSEIRI